MTRRIVWITVLLLFVGGLGGAWFLSAFDRVPVKTRTPPEEEARRNPYLAMQRFLERLGRPVVRQSDAAVLATLPPGGTLILDAHRRAQMTPARLDSLLAWVSAGGYLIAAPEVGKRSDPLLDRFKVKQVFSGGRPAVGKRPGAPVRQDDRPPTDDEPDVPEKPNTQPPKPTATPYQLSVSLPGAARSLHIAVRYPELQASEIAPLWSASRPDANAQLLHFQHGAGHVTFVTGMSSRLNNQGIGLLDHAELLWVLISTYQSEARQPITVLTRLKVPSLWQWLAESAWSALLVAALLVLLWLWRIVPRFGPPVPDPAPERRQLREHLTALGRYIWRAGGLAHWLSICRESFQARLALRHPEIAILAPAEQAHLLARLTGRSTAAIAAALYGSADNIAAFTAAVRLLRHLELSL